MMNPLSPLPLLKVHPADWEAERMRLQSEFGEAITLDALTGPDGAAAGPEFRDDSGNRAGWLIAQRRRGHRHSVDDVLTAWYALQVSPAVSEHLDLGTGIGTVGLLTLWGMGERASLTCVEAQEISYRLLQSNIGCNGLANRVSPIHGDLRELDLGRKFPIVTGSPPYFPPGTGVIPHDSQKAHARFELRGNVADYARTAVAHLQSCGRVVLCFPSPQKQRALDGIRAAGMEVERMRDVIPRQTLSPLFTLFACRHEHEIDAPPRIEPSLVVRTEDGRFSEEMLEVRKSFGFAG